MTHLWSGRFDAPPDDEVFEFQASFRFDRRLFEDDVAGSLAWAEALAGAGVLSRGEATAIRTALEEIRDRGRADPGFVEGPDEDIHAFVERQLIERVGDAGKRLHTGRSRNEQVSLDLRLYLRRRTAGLQRELVALVDALAGRAEAAGPAVMPSYTHLRRAQPILVAHYFLAHAVAIRRDHRRLETAREEADALPSGPVRLPVPAMPSTRPRWPSVWGFPGWWPTVSTRRRTAISSRRFSMHARERWCT